MNWRRFPASVTARLAALFALVVIVTFTLVGSYLYRSLALQLESRDDEELIGKVILIRHLLEEVPSAQEIARAPQPFLDAVFGHEGLMFLIADASGRRLVQNSQWPDPLPAAQLVPAEREPTMNDVRVWETAEGTARLVGARGAVSRRTGQEVQIFFARDSSVRKALLTQYGRDLIFASIVGTLIATLLGYGITHRGLRPVGIMARQANEITSRRLDARLALEEAPTELRDLTRAFNGMLDRLEDGVKRLAGFAADLAHDLRTPLNALMLKSEVALSRPRSADEYQALLASNMEEYQRLSRLIENTLFLARADNARLALRLESIELGKTLGKVAEYFSGLAEEAGISINVHGDGVVLADPVLLDRALSNLIANALRYSKSGNTVRIGARQEGAFTSISVENSGAGIPENQIGRVFDPYFRGDRARADDGGSAGIGLAIVRAIMKLHGGSAGVTSEPNGPTRFTLKFPRTPSVQVQSA